jgi:hypothetical protein
VYGKGGSYNISSAQEIWIRISSASSARNVSPGRRYLCPRAHRPCRPRSPSKITFDCGLISYFCPTHASGAPRLNQLCTSVHNACTLATRGPIPLWSVPRGRQATCRNPDSEYRRIRPTPVAGWKLTLSAILAQLPVRNIARDILDIFEATGRD